jgi:hypothetical protein
MYCLILLALQGFGVYGFTEGCLPLWVDADEQLLAAAAAEQCARLTMIRVKRLNRITLTCTCGAGVGGWVWLHPSLQQHIMMKIKMMLKAMKIKMMKPCDR